MRFVAGRGTGAERHREDVAGRGAVAAEMLLSRTLLAEKPQGYIGKLLLAEKTQGRIGKLLLAGDA